MLKATAMMEIAKTLSKLSTCSRRSVGCVIVDERYRIIGSGYNGVPSKMEHCTDKPCQFATSPHGTSCMSSHAEANALIQCKDVDHIHAIFTTSFPCIECAKLIMNTPCKYLYYEEDYVASMEVVLNYIMQAENPIVVGRVHCS